MGEMKYLELHGDRIAYQDVGSGDEALLLIHGMAGSSETWRAVIPQLSRKYRVVAPDLLGHGQSAKPRGDYSLGAFAVWLRDLLDELGISRATIVGQSLGGGVAMQFVYQHPDYCQRLILISSGGLGPDVGWTLRLLSAPGAELILPVIAPRPVLTAGNKLRSWFSCGRDSITPRRGDVERLLIAVRFGDATGFPADVALGGRLSRSGGERTESAASDLRTAHHGDLGRPGPDHPRRAWLRRARGAAREAGSRCSQASATSLTSNGPAKWST